MCTLSRVGKYQYWITRCEALTLCYCPFSPWNSGFLGGSFHQLQERLRWIAVGITRRFLVELNRDPHGACPVRLLPIW